MRARPRPLSLFRLALWLGTIGFGGGFAVSQRIRKKFVEDERWMTDEEFVERFAVSSALPGTTATNLLSMLGQRFAGLPGAAMAAVGFILPSVALMIAFGALYDHVRGVRVLASFLDGMSYATVGVVAAVAVDMRRSALRTRFDLFIAVATVIVLALGALTLLEVIAIWGVLGIAIYPARPPADGEPSPAAKVAPPPPPSSGRLQAFVPGLFVAASGSLTLFYVFARIGIATFGGGFAMIPPIEHEVVTVNRWLDAGAFNDAMVLGQVTPGPIAIAATFIGYRVHGFVGALAATLGIFGPPFALCVVVGRSLAAFKASTVVQRFLRGVSPAVVGVIAAASISLGRTSLHSVWSVILAAATFVLLAGIPKLSPLLPLALAGAANAIHS